MILAGIPGSVVLDPAPDSVIDLGGGRIVEVIEAGRGHSSRDVCYLDVQTRLLFVGDVLYPGYLYIRSFDSFAQGLQHLFDVTHGRYDFSLGAHVEMNEDGLLFESGARYQPREMPLQQKPEALATLVSTLQRPFVNKYFALYPKANL
jgi:glyoxylase-like metal-dependent hydrolase (beta-lactamase superfamily II)